MYVLIKSKATGDVTDYHNEIHEYERELFLQAGGDSERKTFDLQHQQKRIKRGM